MNTQAARYLQQNIFDRNIQRLRNMGYAINPEQAWNNMTRAFAKIAQAESRQNPRAVNPDGAFGKYQVRRQSADTLAQRLENWIGKNDISDELRQHRDASKLSEPVQDMLMTLEFFNETGSDRFVPDILQGNDIALTEYYNRLHHTNVDEPTIKNWNRALKSDVGEEYYTPGADPNMGSARGGEQMSPAINPSTIDQLARYRLQQGFGPSVTNYATGSYRNPVTGNLGSFAPSAPTAPSVGIAPSSPTWNPQSNYADTGNPVIDIRNPWDLGNARAPGFDIYGNTIGDPNSRSTRIPQYFGTTYSRSPAWNPQPGYPDMGNQQTGNQLGNLRLAENAGSAVGAIPDYDTYVATSIPDFMPAPDVPMSNLNVPAASTVSTGLYDSPAAGLMDNDAVEASAYNARMLSGTTPSPSGGSGFWNWFKQGSNLEGLGTLFQGVSGLGNLVLGYKQYQTQKKNAALARQLARQNYENQAFLTNLALEERQIANQMGGFRTKRQRQRVKETLGK